MAEPRHARVVIVGSGPAGLTAALYTARANLAPVVISGVTAGGQLMLTTEVENYPGFPEGIQGPELIEKFRAQAKRFGTEFVDDDVRSVDLSKRPFRVETGSFGTFLADAVIVATGASARWLDLESEQRLRGHGVSACATCDGFFFKNKEIVVVGGGDSAMEEALFLTKFGQHVTIVHRRGEFRASRIMAERARTHPKITLKLHTEVVEVLGTDHVTGIRWRDVRTGVVEEKAIDGLFLAIGHDPATAVFRHALALDEKGYLKTHDVTRTNIVGVFAAGDVHDHRYRQVVTAAGLGCMAAIDVERWLESEEATVPAAAPPARSH